jgi:hypothetical protein
MLNWLLADYQLFGLTGQNWMLVFGGGLLLYIAVLAIAAHRRKGGR